MLDAIEVKVKEKVKESEQVIRGMRASLLSDDLLTEKDKRIKAIDAEIKILEKRIKEAAEETKQAKDAYDLIKKQVEEAEKIKDAFEKCSGKIAVNEQKIKNAGDNLKKAISRLESLMNDKAEYQRLLPTRKRYEETDRELKLLVNEREKWNKKNYLAETLSAGEDKLKAKEDERAKLTAELSV